MAFATEENLTDLALARWANADEPRLREVVASLIRHLHAFVREIEPSEQEWLAAMDWLARTGQLCTGKRQEFILLSDVLGVSMLVNAINNRLPGEATPSTVLGPFHIDHSPELETGADMAAGIAGEPCFVTGVVRDLDGSPIAGATLDVWQADAEGLYEAQLGVEEARLRAIYRTGADGAYAIRTIVPLGYEIPLDGTVGELIGRTAIKPVRPAHIHFLVSAPGRHPVVTHLFRKGDPHIEIDVVFGVKEALITDFARRGPGRAPTGEEVPTPFSVVTYDFVLSKAA